MAEDFIIGCARGGDHEGLVAGAHADRVRLGYDTDNSVVKCMFCLKELPLKGVAAGTRR